MSGEEEATTFEALFNRLPIMKRLLEMIERYKIHDIKVNDRFLLLEKEVKELRVCLKYGDIPKEKFSLKCPIPELTFGQIYKASKVNETAIYIVFQGRDGNTAVKSFPRGRFYRPCDLTWDNLELVGTIEDILNP